MKMSEEKIDFAAKLAELKKEAGIVSKGRNSGNSKFATVKKVLMEENTCKAEALHKIFSELQEKGIDIKAEYKKIMALVGNLLTYVRNSEKYQAYKGYELVDEEGQFQIIKVD
jgi:gamma-glutamyl phosphate reductase